MKPNNPSRLKGLAFLKEVLSPNFQGDPNQVMKKLNRICRKLGDIQNIMAEASAAQSINDVQGALKLLKKGLKIDPNYLPLHGEAAVLYRRLGQNEKALKELHACAAHLTENKATLQYPSISIARFYANYGRALGDTGNSYDQALEAFDRSVQIEPMHLAGWLGVSDMLYKMGNRGSRLKEVRRTTAEKFPSSHIAAYNQAQSICATTNSGDALGNSSSLTLAAKWYLKAWRLDVHRTDPDYPARAAAVLNALGRLEEAQECIDAALAINPVHDCALRIQCSLSSQRGDDMAGLETFQHGVLLRDEEREIRNQIIGPAIDYVNEENEQELYRGGDTAGNVLDATQRPVQRPSAMVDRLGAVVVIQSGIRTGYEQRIGVVCKLTTEQRITLSVLDEGTTTGIHSNAISSMRDQLCLQQKDIGFEMDGTTKQWRAKKSTVRIRHTLVTPCCNYCYATKQTGGVSKLLKCARCKVATYDSTACQKAHWSQHKKLCKKLVADQNRVKNVRKEFVNEHCSTVKKISHSSWKTHSKAIRTHLKRMHQFCNCSVPWPLTHEVSAMIQDNGGALGGPSYFTCHPNQRFSTTVLKIESKRTGKTRHCMVLRESPERICHDANVTMEEVCSAVPLHTPMVQEMFVLGEVIYTPNCARMLTMHYRLYPGQLFQWPTGETIGVCVGTGEKIKPDKKTIHLMVTWSMFGSVRNGETEHVMNRVFPRILTVEGYEKIVGGQPTDPHRCIKSVERESDGSEKANTSTNIPFYPDFVRLNAKNGTTMPKRKGNPGTSSFFYVPKKARSTKKGPLMAADAFQRYSEDLWEKDWEKYVMVSNSKKTRELNPAVDISFGLAK